MEKPGLLHRDAYDIGEHVYIIHYNRLLLIHKVIHIAPSIPWLKYHSILVNFNKTKEQ